MKPTPEMKKVREKMRPGVITRDGFLGTDTRLPADIIQGDEERMSALGLDWDAVAETLSRLFEKGKDGFGSCVTVDDAWSVRIDENRGMLPCPFGDGLYGKHTAELVHVPTGRTIVLSLLSHHLLAAHHFLQGIGSGFRIEPELLALIMKRC